MASAPPELSTTAPRYRLEGTDHCVDVRLSGAAQLFDNRDPAPFRERDLDPAVVEYLMDAAEDLAAAGSFRLVLWFPSEPATEDLSHAIRAHFTYELDRITRDRRRQRRIGQVSLLVAVTLLVVLQMLAQVVATPPGNNLRNAVKEGLVILSWVVLWRPVEVLIYDWLPVRRQRKLAQRLLDAPIDVRVEPRGQPAPAA